MESAYERQHGPLPPRHPEKAVQVLRGMLEPEWMAAWGEFDRMRDNGCREHVAVLEAFGPLRENPALRDSAEFVIDMYSKRQLVQLARADDRW